MSKSKKPTPVVAKRVMVNSLAQLNDLHAQEHAFRESDQKQRLIDAIQLTQAIANGPQPIRNKAGKIVDNLQLSDIVRGQNLSFLIDGPKDIDAECGYPRWLTPDHYRLMYEREGIAKRVVECEPEETWAEDPSVFETEDEDDETEFETAWDELLKTHNVWHYLQRIDVLSGIGEFGILLMGIDDGADLADPVEGLDDGGEADGSNDYQLLYLRSFSQDAVMVSSRETDKSSPRYGDPILYTVQLRDYEAWGSQAGQIISQKIHWTRVLHVADNRKMSEVYGIPRMQPVFNRLLDLRKIYGADGEAFWKGGFPGLAFEMNPEIADQGEPLDKEGLKKEIDAYMNSQQRYIATVGLTTKTLEPNISDPTPHAESMLKAIAIAKGIPYRVLFGSEEAKLAGDQDANHWNRKLKKRQDKYVTPWIIREFVDRMIAFGVLPEVEEYFVDWPDLNAPSDKEKAAIALQITQAMAAYVQGGLDALIAPLDYLTKIHSFSTEQAEAIIKAAQEHTGGDGQGTEDDEDPDAEQEDDEDDANGPDESPPDDGDAMRSPNLDGTTTRPPGRKAVSSQIPVGGPSTNAIAIDLGELDLIENEWSDAARKAAIESREEHSHGNDDKSKFIGKTVGKAEHVYADNVEGHVAKMIGGKKEGSDKMSHGDPYDVKVKNHAIEVKALLKGKKQSISVHPDALARKVNYAKKTGDTYHTIVVDHRHKFEGGAHAENHSGHEIYYKRGSGRYALSKMHKVKSTAELKQLIAAPDHELPEAAKGSLPKGAAAKKLMGDAVKAHSARLTKDRARKARMKIERLSAAA